MLYDPVIALDGGPDGLAAYRTIVKQLGELQPFSDTSTLVAFEVGYDQANEVRSVLDTLPQRDSSNAIDPSIHRRSITRWQACCSTLFHTFETCEFCQIWRVFNALFLGVFTTIRKQEMKDDRQIDR